MDFYTLADAAMKGVILLVFAACLVLVLRALRALWRLITGVSAAGVAKATGAVAGKTSSAARRLVGEFKDGYKRAQD